LKKTIFISPIVVMLLIMLDAVRIKGFEPLHAYSSIGLFIIWCIGVITYLKKIEK